MSTNIQDGGELAGRKRYHEDFVEDGYGAPSVSHMDDDRSLSDKENDTRCAPAGPSASPAKSSSVLSEPPSSIVGQDSPSRDSTPATHSASATPAKSSAMLKTTTVPASAATGEPPKKRKRATAEEKAARDAALEAEKRKRQEERERKRREKEEAEKIKAQQKAAKAEERAAKAAALAEKEQERKQRAEERERKRREKEEEEAKKARSQMKLTAMFNLTTAPKKEPAAAKSDTKSANAGTGETQEPSLYEQWFKPFFVKEHVRMARDPCELDEETRKAKARILEEYISGQREAPTVRFDPLQTLQLPYKVRRGRVYPSVRKIMNDLEGSSSKTSSDLTTESQTAQMKHALEVLKTVPLKSIKFKEDVRPAYVGTISGLPAGVRSLGQLARKPVSKILPLNYDYDSEAEWVDEEGENVDDLDDEEEELDGDDDMDDFLDDSEDVGPSRMVFSGGMEPESIGPCWEDRTRRTAEPKLYKFRLEFILESLEHHHSIDPFSTAYWAPPRSKANGPSAASASTASSGSGTAQEARAHAMAPPPAPSDAFQALNSGAPAGGGTKKSQQLLPPDMQEELKDLVRSMPTLSKVGVIEFFSAKHSKYSKAQIKASFDAIFEKSGKTFKVRGE